MANKICRLASGLTFYIDEQETLEIVAKACLSEPELLDQLFKLFWNDDAPYEASSVGYYLFIAADCIAGTANNLVGFRLRNPDERVAALATLCRKRGDFHGEIVQGKDLTERTELQ